jgi:predicted KAP-like P-loop ATPase
MYIHDRHIQSEKEEFLGRISFSHNLAESLLNWKEIDSLVIAINGEWGSGKSSILNLVKEYIKNLNLKDKPTLIEFNPWLFSENDNIIEQFFQEIAYKLELNKDSKNDKKIAEKLRYYSKILSLIPDKNLVIDTSSKIVIFLGLLGVTIPKLSEWFAPHKTWFSNLFYISGIVLIAFEVFKDYFKNYIEIFESKLKVRQKSAFEIKAEIRDTLLKRDKKLLIIIDDIDRLNEKEIKQMLRLVRINADFPNTIYLLAFDKRLIEKYIGDQTKISGKDYLEKIIQVNFEIPLINKSKIESYLFKELDRIVENLPQSANKYFETNINYWANVYNLGIKNFFSNIRDVKRYISSLEFNISQMCQKNVMEVNPIDFIAIEAIRLFAPEFYSFMKNQKLLFTTTDNYPNEIKDKGKQEIKDAIDFLPNATKESIKELIQKLFPQLQGILEDNPIIYDNHWQIVWNKDLRICSSSNYDAYFTLIPAGSEEEISRFEIENLLSKTNKIDEFEEQLNIYIRNNKIKKILQKILEFTGDKEIIPQTNIKNILQALYNISDDLPDDRENKSEIGINILLSQVDHQLLKRGNKDENFKLLKEIIKSSKGIFGPVQIISNELSIIKENKDLSLSNIHEDNIEELKIICLEKIIENKDNLLNSNFFLFKLYRWREWDKEGSLYQYLDSILKNDDDMCKFLSKFIMVGNIQYLDSYGEKRVLVFKYQNLKDFVGLDIIEKRVKLIKSQNSHLYESYKKAIDFFLDNLDKKDLAPFQWE